MGFNLRARHRGGLVAVMASLVGLVAAGGGSISPAGATTFANVQCHGTLSGNPLPDTAIAPRAITINVVAPAQVAKGAEFVVTIKGNTTTLPSTQTGFVINNFTNLSTSLRLDGASFVNGSAARSRPATINGTPLTGSIALTANTIKTATPGPIPPGTLVTPDITVKVKAGAAGSAITIHAVTLTTTANLTVGPAALSCPLPNSAVATTNVIGSCAAHDGYWLVGRDGGVYSYGAAQFYGSAVSRALRKPVVGVASAADGKGYWLAASDGGIFAFGDAKFHGSLGGTHLNQPVVAITATPTGKGYWLAASDGGIFAFGDAKFHGSLGGIHLNQPVVAITATPTGKGYRLAASDGGVFGFGDAHFSGSVASSGLSAPVVGMQNTVDGGYRVTGNDGNVYGFQAPVCGSLAGQRLSAQIAGIGVVNSPS